jgi:hypothetical protein
MQIDFKNNDHFKIKNLLPKIAAGTADAEELIKIMIPYCYEQEEAYDKVFREQQTIYDVNHLLPQGVKCQNFNILKDAEYDAFVQLNYLTPSDFSLHGQAMGIIQNIAERDGIIVSVSESIKSMILPMVKAKDRQNFEVEIEKPVI